METGKYLLNPRMELRTTPGSRVKIIGILKEVLVDLEILNLRGNNISEITHLPLNWKVAGATIDFEIKYTTEWGDPYTQ